MNKWVARTNRRQKTALLITQCASHHGCRKDTLGHNVGRVECTGPVVCSHSLPCTVTAREREEKDDLAPRTNAGSITEPPVCFFVIVLSKSKTTSLTFGTHAVLTYSLQGFTRRWGSLASSTHCWPPESLITVKIIRKMFIFRAYNCIKTHTYSDSDCCIRPLVVGALARVCNETRWLDR